MFSPPKLLIARTPPAGAGVVRDRPRLARDAHDRQRSRVWASLLAVPDERPTHRRWAG